jgi:hypothetical protein
MVVCMFYSSTAPVTDKDKEEVTEYFNNNGFERWNKVHMSTAASHYCAVAKCSP